MLHIRHPFTFVSIPFTAFVNPLAAPLTFTPVTSVSSAIKISLGAETILFVIQPRPIVSCSVLAGQNTVSYLYAIFRSLASVFITIYVANRVYFRLLRKNYGRVFQVKFLKPLTPFAGIKMFFEC